MSDIALYTTMYPQGEDYWPPFLASLAAQSDEDFVLFVGLDQLQPDRIRSLIQRYFDGTVVVSTGGGTPAEIRHRALARIAQNFESVVLVDSDDVLLSDRVAAARSALRLDDVSACALALIDEQGREINRTFRLPENTSVSEVLPRSNVFGMSNSCYRCEALRTALPIPTDVGLVDWFLATRSWLFGARLAFDSNVHMLYRQHADNTAGVLGPFTSQRIQADIRRVLEHYRFVLESDLSGALAERIESVRSARSQVRDFERTLNVSDEVVSPVSKLGLDSSRVPMWWEWTSAPVAKC